MDGRRDAEDLQGDAIALATAGRARARAAGRSRGFRSARRLEAITGVALILPALFWISLLVAYPFAMALYYSVSNTVVGGGSGTFVGLANFTALLDDGSFRQTLQNSVVFTVSAVAAKAVLGVMLALILHRTLRLKRLIRGLVLLPFVIPTALSTLGWLWMFDSLYSVITWTVNRVVLGPIGFAPLEVNWLGSPALAMAAVIVVNIWRGLPFFAVTVLAGLTAIPTEFYEAAEVDGAGRWGRFWHVTYPLLKPILAVVVLFSTIFTFADFNIVYVLTRGGPQESTHLFATLSHALAFGSMQLGRGAAVSLFMFPVLVVVVALQLHYLQRDETRHA
ncbi:MAG: sugar ABC transporter permease [Candidatus Rokubacteria bacterium]|nr:sugar ABC transporter permease [Candidatus Rokubacteria bacterium]